MATLTIRNLPDEVRNRLRVRAAENGRSMEAEAREALEREFVAQSGLSEEERRRRVRAVREAFEPYRVPGLLASEELIAERRLEAWKETVEAMRDIRKRGGPIDTQALLEMAKSARRRS